MIYESILCCAKNYKLSLQQVDWYRVFFIAHFEVMLIFHITLQVAIVVLCVNPMEAGCKECCESRSFSDYGFSRKLAHGKSTENK